MSREQVKRCNSYFDEKINSYKQEQIDTNNIEKLSEYYHFKKIEENEAVPLELKICNIGCYYCGADNHFLEKHPSCEVYGLDFEGIVEANKNILSEKLKLFPGYPLEILENENFEIFDYALFTRTATLINIKQFISYMEVLNKLAKNVCFLEVVKISSYTKRVLNIEKIDMMNPIRMYAGMYIHNYPEILRKYGYEIIESSILSPDIFDQSLTSDHYFIYTHGKKILTID